MSLNVADAIYQQSYCIIDHFLNDEDYLALQSLVKNLKHEGVFKPAKIGNRQNKTQNSTIRNDQIFWIEPEQDNLSISAYFKKLDHLCATLNQTLYLGLVTYEAHFAVYQANNFYKKHIDQFNHTKERRISCVYYLNENWQPKDGGSLCLYDRQDQPLINIMPLGNRFVCFESDLPHEVCTAYQTRYSIAAWLKTRSVGRF